MATTTPPPAQAAMKKVAGKAGAFVITPPSPAGSTGTATPVNLPFKVIKPKTNRGLKDSTDSSCYDAASDLVHMAQVAVTCQTTLSVEGFYDLNTTDASLYALCFTSAGPVPVVIYLSQTVVLLHGNFDIEDFEVGEPVDDMVTWTASLKSNQVVVHGS